MSDILFSQHVSIIETLAGAGSFNKKIFVDFLPDAVIVHYLNYGFDGTEDYVASVYTDLLNNIIGSIFDASASTPKTAFKLYGKPINSVYTFNVLDSNGDIDTGRVGTLSIGLEFVKYR